MQHIIACTLSFVLVLSCPLNATADDDVVPADGSVSVDEVSDEVLLQELRELEKLMGEEGGSASNDSATSGSATSGSAENGSTTSSSETNDSTTGSAITGNLNLNLDGSSASSASGASSSNSLADGTPLPRALRGDTLIEKLTESVKKANAAVDAANARTAEIQEEISAIEEVLPGRKIPDNTGLIWDFHFKGVTFFEMNVDVILGMWVFDVDRGDKPNEIAFNLHSGNIYVAAEQIELGIPSDLPSDT